MVLGVQCKSAYLHSEFACRRHADGQAQLVLLPTRDATQAITAAALQTLFGVVPTHESTRSVATTATRDHSFLWAVGHTPFGPFAAGTPTRGEEALSFALRDACARNQLLGALNHTLESLVEHFDTFLVFNHDITDVMR